MAIPVYESAGVAAAEQSNNNILVPFPATVNSGDLLLLHYWVVNNSTPTTPSGWALEVNALAGFTRTIVYSLIAGGGESGDLTVDTNETTFVKMGKIHRFSGADSVEAAGTDGALSKTVAHADIATTDTDRLVCVFTGISNDTSASSFTGESGGDLTLQTDDLTTVGSDGGISFQSVGLSSSGTISGGTWTYNGPTRTWTTASLAIYLAAGGTTGIGAIALPAIIAAGAGNLGRSGDGAADLPPLTASGSGDVIKIGTGAAPLPALVASGEGVLLVSGDGAVALPEITASGAGKITKTGAGSPPLPPITASGAGKIVKTGAGVALLSGVTATGAGTRKITGTGEPPLPAIIAEGSGEGLVSGDGAVALGAIFGAGIGKIVKTGAGAVPLSSLTASGAGARVIAGLAAAALPGIAVAGLGDVIKIGVGAAAFPALGAAGAGAITRSGIGAIALPAFTAAGAGNKVVTGSGIIALPAMTAIGIEGIPPSDRLVSGGMRIGFGIGPNARKHAGG